MNDIRHPQQRKALARKNQLLAVVQENQGLTKKDIASVCYANFGWFPRTTKEHLDLLIEFGALRLEEDQIFTSDYKPHEDQLTLTDLSTIVDKMQVQKGGEEGVS